MNQSFFTIGYDIPEDARKDPPSYLRWLLCGREDTPVRRVPRGTREDLLTTVTGSDIELVKFAPFDTPWGRYWAGISYFMDMILFWEEAPEEPLNEDGLFSD